MLYVAKYVPYQIVSRRQTISRRQTLCQHECLTYLTDIMSQKELNLRSGWQISHSLTRSQKILYVCSQIIGYIRTADSH